MVRRHYGDLSPTLILGNLFTFSRKHFDRRRLVIWSGVCGASVIQRAPPRANRHLERAGYKTVILSKARVPSL
jgi:hypothetical protein